MHATSSLSLSFLQNLIFDTLDLNITLVTTMLIPNAEFIVLHLA